jgi:hypothetical protein
MADGMLLCDRLRAAGEEGRLLLKGGVGTALDSSRDYAEWGVRYVRALAQLARYKMDVAHGADDLSSAVADAVEARRAALAAPPGDANADDADDADGLLERLARGQEAARARCEAAERAMPSPDELNKLQEEAWRHHVVERDRAREELLQLAELRVAGLRAKQSFLGRALGRVREFSELDLPTVPAASSPVQEEGPHHASPLLTACTELVKCVHEMHRETCGEEVRAEIIAIAARIAEEHRGRQQDLRAAHQDASRDLGSALDALRAPAAQHMRRSRAEGLLATLETLQEQVKVARKEERNVQKQFEDLQDDTAPGDPELDRALARLEKAKTQTAALSLRRDGVVKEVAALSASTRDEDIGDTSYEAGVPQLDFPELPVRALRIVQPFRAWESLDASARSRFDVEVLLRRAGLLACERSYASYTGLTPLIASKPSVKQASLRGAAQGTTDKVLKEYGVEGFKQVQRAVSVACRLKHPGVVPVECAFLEQQGNVVVVQSAFYKGRNMRHWTQGKDHEARLRSLQRVAEAVRFLHTQIPSILHRDLKPENIVFDSESPDARPALCDFDISVNALDTMGSTMMRGTLLYLAPDPSPSTASDVFALGMTLLDVMFCDADEERLRQWVLGSRLGVAEIAEIERVRADLERRTEDGELAMLVRSMLSPAPQERPNAQAVAEKLGELLNVRTCCICHCPEHRDAGLACGTGEHFACDECWSSHVSRFEALQAGSGEVKCVAAGCAATFGLQEVAKHATQHAFEALQRHISDRQKAALQDEFRVWQADFEADFAAKTEHERRVLVVRKHVEEMLDLRW